MAIIGIHTVRDPCGGKSTNTQHELLERGDTTTNIGMRQLALVNWNDHDKNANTESGNRTSCIQVR
jgi:hypothetical protein